MALYKNTMQGTSIRWDKGKYELFGRGYELYELYEGEGNELVYESVRTVGVIIGLFRYF
jgi:hypothetical protein